MRAARIAAGLAGLALFNHLGGLLARHFSWSVPGSIVGAFLLLLVLSVIKKAPRPLEEASTPLLGHLMLFLIPSVVPVALTWRIALDHGLFFALASTFVTLAAATACALAMNIFWRQPDAAPNDE